MSRVALTNGIEWNLRAVSSADDQDFAAIRERFEKLLQSNEVQPLTRELVEEYSEREGHLQVKVEPSQKITHGIFLHLNDHYVFETKLEPAASVELKEILDKGWSSSIDRWNQIRSKLEEFAEGLSK